ncbi:MAG TPA: polysaccharide biosynthesis/export family protein [Gemmatimonadota bacterium]|nr:polysaccharide biosynthesis/export family protein [Gemmatimonadota bacterium]
MKHLWMAAVLLIGSATTLGAQDGPRTDTRDDLEARRDSLAEVLVVLDADDERTEAVERRLATVEQRLRLGDFRPGDMVSLDVRGREEFTGNFPVQPDQSLELPGIDPVPLRGVLYSEAPGVIREALATILRNPVVELTYQMRLAVTGQISNPGFYDVRGTLLLSDVLTLAGGPTQNAEIERIEVRRDGSTIMSGEELVTAGFTLDDLGLRSGDVIRIPRERDTFYSLRNVSIILGTVLSVIALVNVF